MTNNLSSDVVANGGPVGRRRVRLLVWDDLDMRSHLADVLVAPSGAGVDLERVYRWLAGRCQTGEVPDGCLFTAVRPGNEDAMAAEVTSIRMVGFSVLAKIQPTLGNADLSAAMWSHIERLAGEADLAEVVVASHDGASFGPRFAGLAQRGTAVTVVGFRERAGYAAGRAGITFVDVESIPGAFATTLPRTNLYDLPSEGRLLPPLRLPAATGTVAAASASAAVAPPAVSGAQPAPAAPPPPAAPLTSVVSDPPPPPLPSRLASVAAPASVPVGNSVIDLTAEERDAPAPVEALEAAPPPPPPPWRAASASGSPDNARPGRLMPPNTGS